MELDEKRIMTQERKEPQNYSFIFRKVMGSDHNFHHSEVDILSRNLIRLLEKHVTHFPRYIWKGKLVQLVAPFAPLIYEWDRLVQLSNREDPDDLGSPDEERAKDDLKLLLSYIAKCDELVRYFKTRDSNLRLGLVTFDSMWTLFAPGTKIIATPYMDTLQMFEVESPHTTLSAIESLQNPDTVASPLAGSSDNSLSWRSIICCGLDFDGTQLVRAPYEFRIPKFLGARAINSLPCYPIDYLKPQDPMTKWELVELSKSRARMFKGLTRPSANRMFLYRGPILSEGFGIIKPSTSEQVMNQDSV
jgi:hypothetical protein